MAGRPLLISIIGALSLLASIFLFIGGVAVALGTIAIDEFGNLSTLGVAGLLILGVIYLIMALGFLGGWPIIWYLGVIIYGIGALGMLIGVLTTGIIAVVPFVINVVVLYYLFRPNVKEFFNI